MKDLIDNIFNSYGHTLIKAGWHIETSEESISLHRFFKNGKPRKGSDIYLAYFEFDESIVDVDDKGNIFYPNKKTRPWFLGATSHPSKTFKNAEAAAVAFLDTATHLKHLIDK